MKTILFAAVLGFSSPSFAVQEIDANDCTLDVAVSGGPLFGSRDGYAKYPIKDSKLSGHEAEVALENLKKSIDADVAQYPYHKDSMVKHHGDEFDVLYFTEYFMETSVGSKYITDDESVAVRVKKYCSLPSKNKGSLTCVRFCIFDRTWYRS